MPTKRKTSLSLTPEAYQLLHAIAASLGISASAALEIVIRDAAKRAFPMRKVTRHA